MVEWNRKYHGKYFLAIIFASIFLFSFGMILHNVFADKLVATIAVNPPNAIAVNPITNIIYSSPGRSIDVIDGTSNTLLTSITLPSSSGYNLGLDVNPNTNMIYVSDGKDGLIYAIDGSSNTVVGTIQVGTGPVDVAVNPTTNTIYVANSGTLYNLSGKRGPTSITVIDGSTKSVTSTIPTADVPSVIVNPVTNLVYVNNGNGTISVLDGSNNNVVGKISGVGHGEMAVDSLTDTIYVADTDNSAFSVIDGKTNSVVTTIHGIAIAPSVTMAEDSNTNKIYVPNPHGDGQDNATITVIDGSTNNVESKIPIPFWPMSMAANSVTDKIYVGINGNSPTDPGIYVIQSTSSTTSQLQVNSQDNNGPITGFYNELYASNGTLLDAGYTPNNFTLNNGKNYTVHVEDYGKYKFSHWLDTGSTNANRTISIKSDGTITAVYKTVPKPPTGLAAMAVSSSQINMSWNAPTNNGGSAITGYKIKRSTDGVTWSVLVKNTGTTDTKYSDTGLQPNTQYSYRVFAINDVGQSLRSNTASNTTSASPGSTAPQPPSSLKALASSSSQIDLSWNAPSDNGGSAITGYDIQRSMDNGNTWSTLVQDTGTTDTTYSDTGLAPNTAYTYQVSAINSVGTSQPSNTASATTTTSTPSTAGITVYAHRIPASYWDPCFAPTCSAGTGPGALMYFELWDSAGNFVQDGYADENGLTFSGLNAGTTYNVYPDNCNRCHGSNHNVVFQYWGDDSSNTRPRAATVGTNLDAWYSCTNNCAGGP